MKFMASPAFWDRWENCVVDVYMVFIVILSHMCTVNDVLLNL